MTFSRFGERYFKMIHEYFQLPVYGYGKKKFGLRLAQT